jgi:hypothetical protein
MGSAGHRWKTFRFDLRLSRSEYLAYYEGEVTWIQVTAFGGTRVRFPASALRKFVGPDGIEGTFELTVDEDERLKAIRRLKSG